MLSPSPCVLRKVHARDDSIIAYDVVIDASCLGIPPDKDGVQCFRAGGRVEPYIFVVCRLVNDPG